MHILRPYYMNQLADAVQEGKKIILLDWWRWSGKTTILRDVMSDASFGPKKYYFSFDDDIVAKKFKSADDFVSYMQIKYGIDFWSDNLLLLNEIQYSKKLLTIFHELLQQNIVTQIIATGIVHTDDIEHTTLVNTGKVSTITVHALTFYDFLDVKNIHTDYLTLEKSSSVVFREIQSHFDEYLTWWWYPAVVTSSTADRKQQILRWIIQKVYDKDVWFTFSWDEILLFQDLMQVLCRQTMEGCKFKPLAKQLEISLPLLKKYIQFLLDNCLIDTIPHFFENKARELCHQDTVVAADMGIISYMTNNFWSKLHDIRSIKNFIANEIIKHLSQWDRLMTYKKVNNSSIDFVIVHADGSLTPIMVSEKNTTTTPKIYANFFDLYGDRIRRCIKTTPLVLHKDMYRGKEFFCVPHFMISKIVR